MRAMRVRRVDEVAVVFNGKTPSKSEQRDSGHPVLKIKDVDALGRFRGMFSGHVVADLARKHVKQQLAGGETLVLNAAHNATHVASKTFYADHEVVGSLATGEWLIVRWSTEAVESRFGNQWINAPETRFRIRRLVNGIHLYPKDVSRLRIPLPPLAEQKRIAGILDAADALRAKRREALAQLDTLLQSTFLDMFGDPVSNPMGWEERPLGQLTESGFRNGLSPSTKGTVEGEVLTLSAITQGRFDFAARKSARFDREPPPSQRLCADTFLICRGNGNKRLVGAGAYPDRSSDDVCFPDTMVGVVVDSEAVTSAYLEAVWRSWRVRSQIERGARTTNGTHKVNQRLLSTIMFPVPPMGLQRRFAAIAQSVERQKATQRAHLAELDTLFASLQSRAFRGDL